MSDLAPTALAIGGGAVGSLFGNPWAGFAAGSLAGQALFPGDALKSEGPRLGDLKVQSSTYGRMIPIAMGGAVRVAGNLIWSSGIRETRNTSSSKLGGKGGGKSVQQASYTYDVDIAVGLCEGQIGGVRRIWANGRLIADIPPPGAGAGIQGVFQKYVASQGRSYTVYAGSETQTADPLIAATEGSANTPAFRGLAYVVFSGFQLGEFGNAVPNLEFEVLPSATAAGSYDQLDSANQFGFLSGMSGTIRPDGLLMAAIETSGSIGKLCVLDPVTLNIVAELAAKQYMGSVDPTAFEAPNMNARGDVLFLDTNLACWIWPAGSVPVKVGVDNPTRIVRDEAGALYIGMRYTTSPSSQWWLLRFDPGESTPELMLQFPYRVRDLWYGYDGYLYALLWDGSTNRAIWQIKADGGSIVRTYTPSSTFTYGGSLATASDGSLFFHDGEQVYRVAPDWGSQSTVLASAGTHTGNGTQRMNREWATGEVLYASLTALTVFAPSGTVNATYSAGNANKIATDPAYPERVYVFNRDYTISNQKMVNVYRRYGLTAATVTLSTVVSALCTRVGLTAGDLTVTALTDSVDGYVLASRMPARDALAPLAQAYFFDAVESDDKLKFVKRTGSSAATIVQDDLGARGEGEEMPELVDEQRTQEPELPLEVTVTFLDKDADYQVSSQYERRLTGRSLNVVNAELPLVMTASKARQLAAILLHEAWMARAQRTIMVSSKYALLEPTDVVTLSLSDGSSLPLRITRKEESGGLIRLEGVNHDAAVYTQSVTGAAAPTPDGSLGVLGPTNFSLCDIPLLRDEDDTYGFYAGASGYDDQWPGAKLFKSVDGGASFADAAQAWISGVGAVGVTLGTLAAFGGGNIFDELSTVSVQLSAGTLTSDTEANVLAGANAILIGDEVLQFKTATATAAKRYTLSGLLRGRLGTEWAMGRHLTGERVVLLDEATLVRVSLASSELNTRRQYKAVTFGQLLELAAYQELSLQAASLKPLAPAQLGGGRAASNDLVITWVRRARKGGGWSDYIDVPLDEPTESYEVEVYAGTVRSLTGITKEADGVFTTSVAHGYAVGDRIHITGAGGMTQVNDRVYTVTSMPTTTKFTVGENTANWTTYTSGGSVRKRGRTITASTTTATYLGADQTTDYGSAQNPIYVAVHQMSSRVGRGFPAIGVL